MIKKRLLGGKCDGEDGARNGDDAFEGGFFCTFFFLRLFRRGFLEVCVVNGGKERQAGNITVWYGNARRIGGR